MDFKSSSSSLSYPSLPTYGPVPFVHPPTDPQILLKGLLCARSPLGTKVTVAKPETTLTPVMASPALNGGTDNKGSM